MNRKALFINMCKYIPFIMGNIMLFSGVVNLFAILMIVMGGYVIIKNLFDYRMVKKNYNDIWEYSYRCHDNDRIINNLNNRKKYNRRIELVRKRIKK